MDVDVLVVGGGISGLAAAFELAQAEPTPRFLVVEAADRMGGQIESKTVDGCLLEAGPDTLLAAKPHGVRMCERLGLQGELRFFSPSRAPIEIQHRGKLAPLPAGFTLFAPTRWGPVIRSPLFSIPGIIRIGLERFIPPRRVDPEDESLTSFVTRRFGRELHERIVEPIVAGLLLADADRLSVRAALPRFLELERVHGSVSRGVSRSAAPLGQGAYLRGGMSRLVDALIERLGVGRLRTSAGVQSLTRSSFGFFEAHLRDGARIRAKSVILACPAHAAVPLVAGLAGGLRGELETLRYAACATVNLIYAADAFRSIPRSSGFFVPRAERSALLGGTFVSTKFEGRAPSDRVLVRAFLGGAGRGREALCGDDATLGTRTHAALAMLVGIKARPLAQYIHRYPYAMPQFDVGHLGWVERTLRAAAALDGVHLAGGCVGAVGIPDCIASGTAAAQRALPATA